jgi:hypothetical protein
MRDKPLTSSLYKEPDTSEREARKAASRAGFKRTGSPSYKMPVMRIEKGGQQQQQQPIGSIADAAASPDTQMIFLLRHALLTPVSFSFDFVFLCMLQPQQPTSLHLKPSRRRDKNKIETAVKPTPSAFPRPLSSHQNTCGKNQGCVFRILCDVTAAEMMKRAQSSSACSLPARMLWRRSPAVSRKAEVCVASLLCRCLSAEAAATSQPPADVHRSSGGRPLRQLRLAVVRPDILDDWIPELNDVDAQSISCADSVTPVWWRCPRCNGRYQSTVQSRVARGPTACPHCGGVGGGDVAAVTASSQSATTAAESSSTASLACTHPALATCWDSERNGELRPSHVSADSSRLVWWRPLHSNAPSSSFAQSFQRPVFAFVQDSASPEQQAAATAAMEWKLLTKIREAARIEEAEVLGLMPVTLSTGGGAVGQGKHSAELQDCAAWSNAAPQADIESEELPAHATLSLGHRTYAVTKLSSDDAAAVASLWKPRVKQLITAMQLPAQRTLGPNRSIPLASCDVVASPSAEGANDAASTTTTPFTALALPRELFAYSFVSAPPGRFSGLASHRSSSTASIVRETLLNQYCDFVRQRRSIADASASPPLAEAAPTPVLNLHGHDDDEAASVCEGAWIDFFRLTEKEVQPRGYIAPEAALYFSDAAEQKAATAATASTSATATHSTFPTAAAAAKAAKPASPSVAIDPDAELVFAYYPRRPSNPPAWEDDVAESVPPVPPVSTAFFDGNAQRTDLNSRRDVTSATAVGGNATRRQRRGRSSPFRIEAPFGTSDAAAASATGSAARLAAEYGDDEDHLAADAGAVLASELLAKTSSSSSSPASLVDSAIAALGSALHSTAGINDDARSIRYHREVQPARGAGTSTQFRLFPPPEGLAGKLSWRRKRLQPGSETTEASKESGKMADAAMQQRSSGETATTTTTTTMLQFDAPRSPRKVARARRLRKDTADEAAPASDGVA